MSTGGDGASSLRATEEISSAHDVAELVEGVCGLFGEDSCLHAVDHAVERLVPVLHEGEEVELEGELRAALLRGDVAIHGGEAWVPLLERHQPVFVVRVPRALAPGVVEAPRTLGAVMRVSRSRFEDLGRSRRRGDMSVAAELQWDLLPTSADSLGAYDVAGVLEPAYEVAGDVFDYALSDGALWAYSLDGMGHGVAATMSSVLVLAALRNARREGADLVEQMAHAARTLHDQHGGDRFVTGVACRLDGDGTVTVVNAGHEPLRTVVAGAVSRLDLDVDLPLGVDPGAAYHEQAAGTLSPGDGLVLFSDGPSSAASPDGDGFGDDRLDAALAARWPFDPLVVGHGVLGDVLAFVGEGSIRDDLTAVVVRRRLDA